MDLGAVGAAAARSRLIPSGMVRIRLVAARRADQRERDAGVAAGRLDDHGARLDQAVALGGVDHRHPDAVLDRAAWVEYSSLAITPPRPRRAGGARRAASRPPRPSLAPPGGGRPVGGHRSRLDELGQLTSIINGSVRLSCQPLSPGRVHRRARGGSPLRRCSERRAPIAAQLPDSTPGRRGSRRTCGELEEGLVQLDAQDRRQGRGPGRPPGCAMDRRAGPSHPDSGRRGGDERVDAQDRRVHRPASRRPRAREELAVPLARDSSRCAGRSTVAAPPASGPSCAERPPSFASQGRRQSCSAPTSRSLGS